MSKPGFTWNVRRAPDLTGLGRLLFFVVHTSRIATAFLKQLRAAIELPARVFQITQCYSGSRTEIGNSKMAAKPFLNLRSWGRMYDFVNLQLSCAHNVEGSALIVGKGLVVGHVFVTYIGGITATQGISMVPTIPHQYTGSTPYILYSSLHRRGRNIKVGDVITFTHPIIPNEWACKRVIGMPGDYVSVVTPGRGDDDVETVDTEGKWASVKAELIQVPEGHCWVAGDNLEWSRDSRLFGPLPLALVKSKVLAVVKPFRDAKWLGADRDIKDPQEMAPRSVSQ
jgi:mitochondrial inner membrane protease subunit 1